MPLPNAALEVALAVKDAADLNATTQQGKYMTTELLDAPVSAVAQYQPFYAQLAELEQSNASLTFDYESKKGNKEARSHVNTLRLTKCALERTRKEAKAESLKIGRAIDSEAAEIEVRIEAMINVHQEAIDAIEKREADRIDSIQARIGSIEAFVPMLETIGSEDLSAGISELELIAIDDSFAEFVAVAAKAKDARLMRLREHLVTVKAKEAEAMELARLRKEAADRVQKDRDDAIAKAAADRAKAEAEQAAKQAVVDAENIAKAEREAAERRELELKLQAENAERRRVEAEHRAEQDRKDAAALAERQAAEAVQRERDRAAAVLAAEAAAQAKREANKAHKAKINRAALAALVEGGISEECAKQCITLIASGHVPCVSIEY